ncbi:MAG: MFS transporter [Spirochaetota bacterium]|jgi:predicted MFS family arabinose efflux permease|nr:MFS transporter [Spirochaetota bacterium]
MNIPSLPIDQTSKRRISRDLLLFTIAVSLAAFVQSLYEAIFPNFLYFTFNVSETERGLIELPRELPGFLVIAISAAFSFLCTRRRAAVAHLFAAVGLIMIGLYPASFSVMIIWLFILSIGQHLFLPLQSSIGMELAPEGHTGRVLGRLQSWGNIAGLLGSLVVFLGLRFLGFSFAFCFVLGGIGFFAAAIVVFFMQKDEKQKTPQFRLRREYGLYYWLCILYGTRKQLFLTFAPWVLVTVFEQPATTLAMLLLTGGVIGIFFKPWIGKMVDRYGERLIITLESAGLICICIVYAIANDVFTPEFALYATCACYIIDQLLFSVGIARATWLKKIALSPDEVPQTLTMGVSIDHLFSITIALLGGVLWNELGYTSVFLMGAGIACINLISARFIRS